MAVIQSGASSDLWTIDGTSKAGRVTLYDPAGNEIFQRPPTGAYVLPINIRQTAATAANQLVWAMRLVTSSRRVYIRQIVLACAFDGTAAASTSRYGISRCATATATGGTAIPVIKKRSNYSTSDVTDARFLDTGLTIAGMTFETAAFIVGCPRGASGASVPFVFGTDDGTAFSSFELASGEGLGIGLSSAAVVGDSLVGWVAWDER